MENPLHYFEELFSYDQSQEKKEKLNFHETEYWEAEVIKIDHVEGIITVRSVERDESTGKLMNGTATISFFNSFESEINAKSKLLKKYILEKTLEISSTGVSSETFLQQITSKFNLYKQKSDLFYSKYPFVKLKIEDLLHFVLEQLPKSEISKSPLNKKPLIATPVQANNIIPISETPHH